MLLIRHGQSHFNKHFSVTRQDPGIIDPAIEVVRAETAGGSVTEAQAAFLEAWLGPAS